MVENVGAATGISLISQSSPEIYGVLPIYRSPIFFSDFWPTSGSVGSESVMVEIWGLQLKCRSILLLD